MTKSSKGSDKADVETDRVGDVKIRIVKLGDKESLSIDGKPFAFRKLPNGYLLEANFFVEPSKTLMAAAKAYASQQLGGKRE